MDTKLRRCSIPTVTTVRAAAKRFHTFLIGVLLLILVTGLCGGRLIVCAMSGDPIVNLAIHGIEPAMASPPFSLVSLTVGAFVAW
jgi:hypothetical protein